MFTLNTISEKIIPSLQTLNTKLLKIYQEDYSVEKKSDHSPLTIADKTAHTFLTNLLEPFSYPILSEESEENFDRQKTETFWIIDPLDGTKDFIQKTDEFSIMIGLVQNKEVVLGVVSVPAQNKIYYAIKNEGAFLWQNGNTKKLQVSETQNPEGARIIVSRNHFSGEMKDFAEKYNLELVKCGSNGVKMGRIAEGNADIFFNPTDRMGLWDSAGPEIIVSEAGGMVSGIYGDAIDYCREGVKNPFGIVATNGKVHQAVIDYFKSKNS